MNPQDDIAAARAAVSAASGALWTVLVSKGSWSGEYTARNLSGADPAAYGLVSNWLFAAAGGTGEDARAPHSAKGSTHGNFLCGLFDKGVMIFIDQHRDIRLALAPTPETKIERWGNQDSRYNGSMWPDLEGCKEGSAGWLGLRDMPQAAHDVIRQTIADLLLEGYEAAEKNRCRREAVKAKQQAEAEQNRAKVAAAWGTK